MRARVEIAALCLFALIAQVLSRADAQDLASGLLGPAGGRAAEDRAKSAAAQNESDTVARGMRRVEEVRQEDAGQDRWQGEATYAPHAHRRTSNQLDTDAYSSRRRFAICIGIDQYHEASGFSPLRFAASDAAAVATTLLTRSNFDQALLICDSPQATELRARHPGKIIVEPETTQAAIREKVQRFIVKANRFDDVVILYYAGHGHSGRSAFLVPSDYEAELPRPINVAELFDWMALEPVRAHNKLIVIDACRSALNDSTGRVMARTFRNALVQPEDRLTVLTGCDADQASHEDASLAHGRFTWSLLDALTGNGFKPGEEHLLVSHLYEHIIKSFQQRKWSANQLPQQFAAGPTFSLAHRSVPKPAPLDEFEWEYLRRDHGEAQKRYRLGELERASSAYRYATRATRSTPLKDDDIRRIHGQILFEHALVQHRLGLKKESQELRAEAVSFRPDSPLLLTLEGCDLADKGLPVEALAKLTAAVERAGEQTAVDDYVWSLKASLEESLGRFADATLSFGKAAQSAYAAGKKRAAAQAYQQMRRLDFEKAWLEQARLTKQPRVGLQANLAAYSCAKEIYGENHWRTKECEARLEALQRQSQLPWERLRAILELESLYTRLNDQDRDVEALSIAQALSDLEVEVHGPSHAWTANSFSNIGRRLTDLSRFPDAIKAYQQALTNYQKFYGPQHPTTLRAQLRLASALQSAGDKGEAERHRNDAGPHLDGLMQLASDDASADMQWDFGYLLYYANRFEKAIPLLDSAASGYEAAQQPADAAWMHGWVGDCYRELKQDEQAIKAYEVSFAKFQKLKNTEGVSIEARNLGKALFRLKKYEDAIPIFAAAAQAYAERARPHDSAWMNDWAGDCLRNLKRGREALEYYEKALIAFEKLAQPADVAEVKYELANTVYEAGEYERARSLFEASVQSSEAANLPMKAAWSRALIALCLKKLNLPEQAVPYYRAALEQFANTPHKENIAAIHELYAAALVQLRQYPTAIEQLMAAAEANEREKRPLRMADNYLEAGTWCLTLKRKPQADEAFAKALAILDLQPNLDGEGTFLLGKSLYRSKQQAAAIPKFQAAAVLYENQKRPLDVAAMHTWIGDCYYELNRNEEAVQAYENSLRRFHEAGKTDQTAYVVSSLAQTLYRLKRFADASPHFIASEQIYRDQHAPIDAAKMHSWLGDCQAGQGDSETALVSYRECLAEFEKLKNDEGIALNATKIAGSLLRAQKYEEAIPSLALAAAAHDRAQNPADAGRIYLELGNTLKRLNRFADALQPLEQAEACYAKVDLPLFLAFAPAIRGQCYRELKRGEEALQAFEVAVKRFAAIEHTTDLSILHRDYAKTLYESKRFAEAAQHFDASAKEYARTNRPLDVAWMRSWQGDSHRELKQHEQAISAYEMSLGVFRERGHAEGIADDASDLGKCLFRLKKYEQAIPVLREAAVAYEELKKPTDAAWLFDWIGACYRDLKQDESAAAAYRKAYDYFTEKNELEGIADEGSKLGQALVRLRRHAEAVPPCKPLLERMNGVTRYWGPRKRESCWAMPIASQDNGTTALRNMIPRLSRSTSNKSLPLSRVPPKKSVRLSLRRIANPMPSATSSEPSKPINDCKTIAKLTSCKRLLPTTSPSRILEICSRV